MDLMDPASTTDGRPVPADEAEPGPLRVLRPRAGRDLAAAERAAAAFLAALGVDVDADGLADTPGRVARAYAELLTPREFRLTTFDNDEGYDELVVARAIPIRSVCEHHFLPFLGVAHVGYLPGRRILGLSKLARVVELFAHGPQVQERLTRQIADWLTAHLRPKGVGVVVEAEHLCMTLRGVRAVGATTITSTLLGTLRDDPRSRAEFFALTGVGARA
ncbi:GTP cyclohydrolase I FolE [Micromonospora sp. C28SCA-DRY-2]|uniref:GTP cyclohydrolase I FolE n=1 Tax=Micromonospora sp. C28SCA-DRY-2 TaxID=3059522 RepID=UPI00267516B7|nr:GTP cyclohydrolase I FolE [Micromonospora sp. C28SCA-DRY-2]MDO3705068.1 GTP cyclohydrolase I FolE [Micromonospora sp. C28SCA-DRY-2]